MKDTIYRTFHQDLGEITFATSETWTVGTQIWSDAVQTTICSGKTDFDGGTTGSYLAACRSNPDYKGDLFSWEMINQYKDYLCPNGWRVPTKDDFVALDIALGGTGENSQSDATLLDRYLTTWGGSYGGRANSGALFDQGSNAYYWSQTESTAVNSYHSCLLSSGTIYPQNYNNKNLGYALRCVRDNN